ncbi:MAG: DUF3109 family protein [Bacteroidota bacterium]
MYDINHILVSEAIVQEQFVCDLTRCKGACCVEGDAGAPVEPAEINVLKQEKDKILPYLTAKGRNAIEVQGVAVDDSDGDDVTPLVDDKECAYAIFDAQGIASCGIEKAYEAGATTFRKPISCHLYPVRMDKLRSGQLTANYHKWKICDPACSLGKELKVPTYKFVKEALIRKFGQEWYTMLDTAVKQGY